MPSDSGISGGCPPEAWLYCARLFRTMKCGFALGSTPKIRTRSGWILSPYQRAAFPPSHSHVVQTVKCSPTISHHWPIFEWNSLAFAVSTHSSPHFHVIAAHFAESSGATQLLSSARNWDPAACHSATCFARAASTGWTKTPLASLVQPMLRNGASASGTHSSL